MSFKVVDKKYNVDGGGFSVDKFVLWADNEESFHQAYSDAQEKSWCLARVWEEGVRWVAEFTRPVSLRPIQPRQEVFAADMAPEPRPAKKKGRG